MAPPLINLFLISYIFSGTISHYFQNITSVLPNLLQFETLMQEAKKLSSMLQLPEMAAETLEIVRKQGNSSAESNEELQKISKIATDTATLLKDATLVTLGYFVSGLIFSISVIIFVSFVIDGVLRVFGWLSLFRISVDQTRLVAHQSLRRLFLQVHRSQKDYKKDKSRYFMWLAMRYKLDKISKETTYFKDRTRLIVALSLCERVFSHIPAYLCLAVFSIMLPGDSDGSKFLVISALLIVSAVILHWNSFRLSRSIIHNDIETFIASEHKIDFDRIPKARREERHRCVACNFEHVALIERACRWLIRVVERACQWARRFEEKRRANRRLRTSDRK